MLKFKRNTFYTALLLILSSLTFPVAAFSAETAPAQELIVSKTTELLNQLKTNNGSIKKDSAIAYTLVEDIVLPHIDFRRIGQIVLGKYWRRATDEQRARFVNEFQGFLVRTYVTAMVEFSDQIVSHADNVRYLPFRSNDPEDVTVRMEIRLSGRPPVSVNYSLYLKEANWFIYDLSVEGISLATTYRSSFASSIRRGGLDNLINKLAARNEKAAAARQTAAAIQ
ncbi:MAG: ABC transporter substrate-binding protein [Sulfuriflexus sp.]|nr:ABC transporter substrate-binding protein [Sulfuriflexus sp.]